MATRFYLPSTGSPAVSPAIGAGDWNGHINTDRRPLNAVNGGSAIATTTFAPDAADHLVAGRAHFVQFVSDVLPPQTIAAQTVKLQVRIAEAHANNNLLLNWKVYAVSEDGSTVLGALLAIRADATEPPITLINRSDAATTTAFSATVNFRLVVEIGLGGTPTATTGVQGHNGSMSFGENAATDLPEDDVATAALNPWLQFAQNLKFGLIPSIPGTIRVEVAIARGDPTDPAGWTVTPSIFAIVFPFEARWRIGWVFTLLSQVGFKDDDILVMSLAETFSASLRQRVREVRDFLMPNKVCLLDGGVQLTDLTAIQILSRVG